MEKTSSDTSGAKPLAYSSPPVHPDIARAATEIMGTYAVQGKVDPDQLVSSHPVSREFRQAVADYLNNR